LENGNRVYFTEQNAVEVAMNPRDTTLTAFFKLCAVDEFARTLLYVDVPKHYTWNVSRKSWSKRKTGTALGRVYTVSPSNKECFFLRLLLHKVRGPRSFVDIRTVANHVCETYREACQLLGLLEGDNHWDESLAEAKEISVPSQIRDLFAIIICTCNPSNPLELWNKYKTYLSEDILARVRRENPDIDVDYSDEIFNEALVLLEDKCDSICNRNLEQLGLPSPVRNRGAVLNSDYLRERNYNMEELRAYVAEKRLLFNTDQNRVYQTIMDAVANDDGAIFFLQAPGGTGKTFTISVLLAEIRSRGEIAVAVASSGIAATLMEGGRTAHSAFKIPLDIARQESPTCNISRNSGRAEVLRECKIIVWDECTMAHYKSMEAINATLKDIRRNDSLMGGTVVIFSGDFRQILPVVVDGTPADEIKACLKTSPLWRHTRTLTLTQNMRVSLGADSDVSNFSDLLLQIGDGRFPQNLNGEVRLTDELCNVVQSADELINSVYPDILNNYKNLSWLTERAILAAKNDDVGSMNAKILSMLPGEPFVYESIDTNVEDADAVHFTVEVMNTLNPPGMPPHRLHLKVGTPIMLLRNMDPPKLCNGTRLCVKSLMQYTIEAVILTGKGAGETVLIPRIPLIASDLEFPFKRLQFPVRVAFAITINKSQGQSIKYCGVDLRSPCFSHGQFYVACSRVGSPRNLYILAPGGETKNIVYRQVLE
jgi:hypothetical protein